MPAFWTGPGGLPDEPPDSGDCDGDCAGCDSNGSDAAFEYSPWDREDAGGEAGGGGVRGLMKGKVFEKVGVNVSTVGGAFAPEFARQIHGAEDDPSFFATATPTPSPTSPASP